MSAPMHNTRAMKMGVVTEGWGKLEMVTPYMSEQEERSPRNYRRVSGELRPGVVFVVPAGHPWVMMASTRSNLQVLCFEVNARGNLKLALAGIYTIYTTQSLHIILSPIRNIRTYNFVI